MSANKHGFTQGLYELVRDSAFGVVVNRVSKNRYFQPTVLSPGYQISPRYSGSLGKEESLLSPVSTQVPQENALVPSPSQGAIIVDWESEDDPENPKNWPFAKKVVVLVVVSVLSGSGYMASAIFSPAEQQMREFFNTTEVRLMLGMTLFVWGYGLSPILVSTMSESPMFGGRRWILLLGQFFYVILQIPTALINHISSFAVLRLLAGLCVGPSLSVGASVITDVFEFPGAAFAIIAWACGIVTGPYVGPLIGAALSHANTWRWIFWFLTIVGGVALAGCIFCLPETSAQAILMKKAERLRALTGNPNIKAKGDIRLVKMTLRSELVQAVWLPVKICLREPVLDLVNLHMCLLYSVLYLFFEAFPIVFLNIYHFTLVELGCAYAALTIGCLLAIAWFSTYLYHFLVKPMRNGTPSEPEVSFGIPVLVAAICLPVGLFIFGWSATPHAHWMGPVVGSCVFIFGTFIMFQSYTAYIGSLYPTMFASALASNAVLRSLVGGAFPLFGTIMYNHTAIKDWPVGWGSSIMGFSALAMVGLPIYFIRCGPDLRKRAYARWGVTEEDCH